MDYNEAKLKKEELERTVDELSDELNVFNIYENGMGLLPESIRESEEYRESKGKYDTVFKILQEYNQWFLKEYKKEYLADRKKTRQRGKK